MDIVEKKKEEAAAQGQGAPIKVKYLTKGKLDKFCGERPHQNVVL